MPEDPQATFRAELSSLRDLVIGSISGGSTSNTEEGFGIYRRLLEHLLERFRELEQIDGVRPQYQLPSLGQSSGQEVGWLVSDCWDFVRRALSSDDADMIMTVAGGVFGISTTCMRMGDASAFSLFVEILIGIWSATYA
jgi:hypothetical protein